jgi:hypothetical protein
MKPDPRARSPAPQAAGRVSEEFNCCAALNVSIFSSPSLRVQAHRLALLVSLPGAQP